MRKLLVCLALLLALTLSLPASLCFAADEAAYRNPDTGYCVIIKDETSSLSEDERAELLDDMIPLTAFCSVGYWSSAELDSQEIEAAVLAGETVFDPSSLVLFSCGTEYFDWCLHWYGEAETWMSDEDASRIQEALAYICNSRWHVEVPAMYFSSVLTLHDTGSLPEFPRPELYIRSEDGIALTDAAEYAQSAGEYDVYYTLTEDLTLEADLTLVHNLYLSVEGCTLHIPASVTLTVDYLMRVVNGSIEVEGSLSGEGSVFLQDGSLISFRDGGIHSLTGGVFVPSGSPFPISGLPESSFVLMKGDEYDVYQPGSPVRAINGQNDLSYTNPSTGYRILVIDTLGLLTAEERKELLRDMEPITEFGNVAFWTTNEYTNNEVEQARLKRRSLFELESGVIFAINMKVRKLTIQSYGRIYTDITVQRANSITNNVRSYATNGDYYGAASRAYQQIHAVLNGNRIAQPMKHFSNVCLALMLGLILAMQNVFRRISSFHRAPPEKMLLFPNRPLLTHLDTDYLVTERTYSPPSNDSGSSSCSSCSSGGSSCSSCGGGGSSSF